MSFISFDLETNDGTDGFTNYLTKVLMMPECQEKWDAMAKISNVPQEADHNGKFKTGQRVHVTADFNQIYEFYCSGSGDPNYAKSLATDIFFLAKGMGVVVGNELLTNDGGEWERFYDLDINDGPLMYFLPERFLEVG